MKHLTFSRSLVGLAALVALSGCSVLSEDKVDYKNVVKAPGLDIPPDLTRLQRDSRYAADSALASAVAMSGAKQPAKDAGVAANSAGDVRLVRSGSARWLEVQRPADQVWDGVREFWTRNGFTLTTDSAELGILETDWAENRAKIPQDFLRRTLGKVIDGLYSSGERDRYRTRIERNSNGAIEIFVTHKGVSEEFDSAQKQSTVWMPRPSDPELEIEFLRRLMVQLGGAKDAPEAIPTASAAAAQAVVSTIDGQPTLALPDAQDRAWRRIGLALDRSGFAIDDRDRQKGLYFVSYAAAAAKNQSPGFFARLFGNAQTESAAPQVKRYQIQLQAQATHTHVRVQTASGQAEASANADTVLQLLAKNLR